MSERQDSLGRVFPLQAKRKWKKWKIRYNIISPRSSVQIKILVKVTDIKIQHPLRAEQDP